MTNLYPKQIISLTNTNLWVPNPASVRNIDLRAKLHSLLFGDRAHPGQGKIVLVRCMQTVCPCILEERGQKMREPDPQCSVCHGEGYTYIDKPYTAWRSVIDSHSGSLLGTYTEQIPGLTNIVGYNFIFEWDTPISAIDKIIEIELNSDGSLPTTNISADDEMTNNYKKFKISQLVFYRGDMARVEYVRCICEREEW